MLNSRRSCPTGLACILNHRQERMPLPLSLAPSISLHLPLPLPHRFYFSLDSERTAGWKQRIRKKNKGRQPKRIQRQICGCPPAAPKSKQQKSVSEKDKFNKTQTHWSGRSGSRALPQSLSALTTFILTLFQLPQPRDRSTCWAENTTPKVFYKIIFKRSLKSEKEKWEEEIPGTRVLCLLRIREKVRAQGFPRSAPALRAREGPYSCQSLDRMATITPPPQGGSTAAYPHGHCLIPGRQSGLSLRKMWEAIQPPSAIVTNK